VVVVCAVVAYLAMSPRELETSPAVGWVLDQRIRAGYSDPGNSSDLVQRLSQIGVNTIMVPYSYFDHQDPLTMGRIEETAQLYRDNGLHFFVSIYFLIAGAEYRHAVHYTGDEKVAPCPLDREYWENVVLSQLASVAEASKVYPIDGVLMDTEMYTSPSAHYYSENLCFGDDCFQQYLTRSRKGSGMSAQSIAPGERRDWLASKGYLEEYYAVLERRTEDLVGEVAAKVHEINPDLIMGFLLYEDNWYYRALARAFSTPSVPALVLDEATYIGGYTYQVDDKVEYFQERDMNVLYLPGLWLRHHTPDNLTAQAFHLATNTSGYWIFPLMSIWADPDSLSGDFEPAGPQDEFWESLRTANAELDRYLETGGKHRSELALVVREESPLQFQLLDDQSMVVIRNEGFAERRNLRVAVNGKLVAAVQVLGSKGISDPIRFERIHLNTTKVFGLAGIEKVAVRDSSGRIHNLLGETDPSVFPRAGSGQQWVLLPALLAITAGGLVIGFLILRRR
jgi:hypothetical protein